MATPKLTMPTEPGTNPSRTEEIIQKGKAIPETRDYIRRQLVHHTCCGMGAVHQGNEGTHKSFDHYLSKTDVNIASGSWNQSEQQP